jgi:hypothetical protein
MAAQRTGEEWPPAPPEPAGFPARPPAEDWPPALVIAAGVGGFLTVVPAVFLAFVGSAAFLLAVGGVATLPWSDGATGEVLVSLALPVQLGAAAVALPVLQVVGAVRLMSRRDRWMLVFSGLPMTALAGWLLGEVLLSDGQAWPLLVLLGPTVAPVLALLPSVGRWLADAPGRRSSPGVPSVAV